MMSATALVLVACVSLCRAANVDIISRMDRSMMPYSGSARNPFRRYRYPIYNKRFNFDDDSGEQDSGDDDPTLSLSSWTPRYKRPYGLSPRYDLAMTPYDLKVMEKLYRSGRRKRTPDLYDLQQGYKIFEAGRKRSPPSAEGGDERRRRNNDFTRDVWKLAHMADVGKRSPVTSYYDLLDMAKLAKAGKRSGADTYDPYSLWQLAQMEEAGRKRAINDYDLMSLARIEAAGKRADLGEDSGDGEDDGQLTAKKKRSLDDYFGWDRKKKSVSEDAMVDDYLHTMEKEVLGGPDKRRGLDDTAAANKDEQRNEED